MTPSANEGCSYVYNLSIEYLQRVSLLCAKATEDTRTDSCQNKKQVVDIQEFNGIPSQHVIHSIFFSSERQNESAAMSSSQTDVCSVAPQHPGYVPMSMMRPRKVAADQNSTTQSSSNYTEVYLPSCTSCGNPLQPGYNRTTVTVHENSTTIRSRTQIRRDSRKKKRYTKKQRQLSSSASHQATEPSNLAIYIQNYSEGSSVPPKDCIDYLEMTCGICHFVTLVPGTKRIVDETESNGDLRANSKIPKRPRHTSKTGPNTTKDDDIIALPAVEETASSKRKSNTLSSLSLHASKKKKKSKDFMSFLSSLND